MKRAQFTVMAFEVSCPHCQAAQPCPTGSEMWTPDDLPQKPTAKDCIICATTFIIGKAKCDWPAHA